MSVSIAPSSTSIAGFSTVETATIRSSAERDGMRICQICRLEISKTVPLNPPYVGLKCDGCEVVYTESCDNPTEVNQSRYPLEERVETYSRRRREFEKRFKATMRYADITSGASVLEIGGNVGAFAQYLERAGCSVAGVEINEMLACYQRSIGLRCMGDLSELGAADNQFDFIVLMDVLEHVPDFVGLLRQLKLLLKEGAGSIVLQFPDYQSAAARLAGERWLWWEAPDHLQHFTTASIPQLASAAGCDVVKTRNVSPVLDDLVALAPRIGRLLGPCNQRVGLNVLGQWGYGSLIQATLRAKG